MAEPFIDTNIFLRHILNDNEDHSPRAQSLMAEIRAGRLTVHTSEIVIFETAFTLERSYKHSKASIRETMQELISMRNLKLPRKDRLHEALDNYLQYNVSFADAYHAVLCIEEGLSPVLSFDHDFDRLAGITRVEP